MEQAVAQGEVTYFSMCLTTMHKIKANDQQEKKKINSFFLRSFFFFLILDWKPLRRLQHENFKSKLGLVKYSWKDQ